MCGMSSNHRGMGIYRVGQNLKNQIFWSSNSQKWVFYNSNNYI
jgi:hypothetical protein